MNRTSSRAATQQLIVEDVLRRVAFARIADDDEGEVPALVARRCAPQRSSGRRPLVR